MIHLVLCWHFHQPDYRDETGNFVMPWTYLHAVKDYVDMAAHLEAHPDLRAVVNFVPTLLEQLDDYDRQFKSGDLRDPVLASLVEPRLDRLGPVEREALIRACFHLNAPTMLDPFPGYRRLRQLWEAAAEDTAMLAYLSGDYLADLVTWYHLAWTGESVRRAHPWLLAMLEQGNGFSLKQRRALFHLLGDLIANLLPRYRALAERGQIELSSTPHSHPIAPLLIDLAVARQARPELPLPEASLYPGGGARLEAHIEAALDSHAVHFGAPPRGLWPAEGGVSSAALARFSEADIRWVASGEGVLRHTLAAAGQDVSQPWQWLLRPYRLPGHYTSCFFRDDYLSDLIGFEYKTWFARDAVRHFLHALEERYRPASAQEPVVSIVLDGENAWEYYPYNGWYFLSDLYQALSEHPEIRTTTFSEYLDDHGHHARALPRLVAGSWVYGDFTTWIGDPAKNRAWDLLCRAKQVYDDTVAGLDPKRAGAAERLLRSCESSDWFWWFGDYNPAASVQAFDRLFRGKLRALYHLLGQPVPADLELSLSAGGGAAEAGGVMRRGGA